MSYAIDALILIRLDARAGHMVGVTELADHMQVDPQVVATRIESLAAANHVHVQRVAGMVFAAGVADLQDGALACE